MHHSFHCGLILRYNFNPTSPWIHVSWTLPGLAPQKLEGSTSYRKCRIFTKANAQVSRLQPETIRKIQQLGNTSGQSLANYKLFDHCRLNRYSNKCQPNNQLAFWSLCMVSLHGCGWKLYGFESHVQQAGLPIFLTPSNPTPAPPWRVWALSMQLPGHHRAVIQWARMNLDCVVNTPNSWGHHPSLSKAAIVAVSLSCNMLISTSRIILVSAMFTNIISFLAAATRATLMALLLLSVISQDSAMQHGKDQKRPGPGVSYVAYVIQTHIIIRIDKTEPNIYNIHTVFQEHTLVVAFHMYSKLPFQLWTTKRALQETNDLPLSTKVLEAMHHGLAPQSLRTTIPGRSGRYYLGNIENVTSLCCHQFSLGQPVRKIISGKLRWRSMNQSM